MNSFHEYYLIQFRFHSYNIFFLSIKIILLYEDEFY